MEDCKFHRTGSIYGIFAYAFVILTCFAEFFFDRQFFQNEGMVLATFALGAFYASLGIVSGSLLDEHRLMSRPVYFVIQCALLTAMLFISPVRGFFGIIVLPVMSQAIFDLSRRWSSAVVLFLFSTCVGVVGVDYGWSGVLQASVNYAAAFIFTIVFTLITKQAVNARQREEKLRREIEIANTQLRAQAAQTEELATTRERNRLAREIHDGVGHYLTVVKTQLDAAAAILPAQPEKAREAIEKAAKLTGEALADVRRSVGTLRTDTIRPPLPEALRSLTQDAGVPITVRIDGPARTLSPGLEHALFRSAQEGLTNIRKHAAASAAELALHFQPGGQVTLALTDNGRGVSADPVVGFGLLGIRERIELLGGRVEAGNRPEGGFALKVEVPA